jgi:signal transduction histidine kinase
MGERADAPGRSRAAISERPRQPPGALRARPAQFARRSLRDLAFCAVEAVLGLAGLAVLAILAALPLLAVILAWGFLSGHPPAHPSRPVTDAALLASLALAVILVPSGARWLSAAHRRLAARLLGERISAPAARRELGVLRRLGTAVRDGPGWKAAAYQVLKLPLTLAELYGVLLAVAGVVSLTCPLWWQEFQSRPPGAHPAAVVAITPVGLLRVSTWPGSFAALGIGAWMLLAAPWVARACVGADRWLMREMLGPGPLAQRVADLEEARTLAVEDSAALLRRLERDLHDGAQVRLVTLAMNLGMAREKLGDQADPAVRELLDAAHVGAKDALAELRNLARGIHPPVLDNGLADALATLAGASVIPAELTADIGSRPTPAIETIAYFCATELLANATKHSDASQLAIAVTTRRGTLTLEVRDNGRGGVQASAGGGLAGLRQRVRTVDGRLDIVSPAGGPTRVTVTLPMRA